MHERTRFREASGFKTLQTYAWVECPVGCEGWTYTREYRFTLLSLIPNRLATSRSFTPARRTSIISRTASSPSRSTTRLGTAALGLARTQACRS